LAGHGGVYLLQEHVEIQLRDALGNGLAVFEVLALAFLVQQRLDAAGPLQGVEIPQRLGQAQGKGLVVVVFFVPNKIVEPLHLRAHHHLPAGEANILGQVHAQLRIVVPHRPERRGAVGLLYWFNTPVEIRHYALQRQLRPVAGLVGPVGPVATLAGGAGLLAGRGRGEGLLDEQG